MNSDLPVFLRADGSAQSPDEVVQTFSAFYAERSWNGDQPTMNRRMRRYIAACLKMKGGKHSDPFTMKELKQALATRRRAAAGGEDRFHYAMMTDATPSFLQLVLDVFNCSWKHGLVPSQ